MKFHFILFLLTLARNTMKSRLVRAIHTHIHVSIDGQNNFQGTEVENPGT